MKTRIVSIMALALAFSTPCFSGSLPTYNPEVYCTGEAKASGTYSAAYYNACIKMEQGGYNSLKKSWASTDTGIADYCLNFSSSFSGGSYFALDECVKRETQAKTNKSTFNP